MLPWPAIRSVFNQNRDYAPGVVIMSTLHFVPSCFVIRDIPVIGTSTRFTPKADGISTLFPPRARDGREMRTRSDPGCSRVGCSVGGMPRSSASDQENQNQFIIIVSVFLGLGGVVGARNRSRSPQPDMIVERPRKSMFEKDGKSFVSEATGWISATGRLPRQNALVVFLLSNQAQPRTQPNPPTPRV